MEMEKGAQGKEENIDLAMIYVWAKRVITANRNRRTIKRTTGQAQRYGVP